MWHDLLTALALLLVLEGIMPFLNPSGMKRVMLVIAQMDDKQLRISGFFAMLAGVILLYLVN